MKGKILAVVLIVAVLATLEYSAYASLRYEDPVHLKSRTIVKSLDHRVQEAVYNFIAPQGRRHLIIQLDHIPSEAEKSGLEGRGIELLSYLPEKAWIASVGEGVNPGSMEGVILVEPLLPEDKIDKNIMSGGKDTLDILVVFFLDTGKDEVKSVLGNYDFELVDWNKIIIRDFNKNFIKELAGHDEVEWVEKAPFGLLSFNDGVRSTTGVNAVQGSAYGLNGTGVVVAEWDEGYANHSDYNSRTTIGDPGEGSAAQHSTHVAGTMVGDGNLSENQGGTALQWKGVAPNASLITYEWPSGSAETLDEFNHSIAVYGTVISQNSWGYDVHSDCGAMGDYDSWSQTFDNITKGNRVAGRMTIVFAAGNERTTTSPYCGSQGYPAYNTSPGPGATAKNVITVGAVSKTESMTSFSSWGPTDDGRIKPDIVGVGQSVKSTNTGNAYTTLSGTSMAAPGVSGIIALMHQDYKNSHGSDPFPSTDKALLIHTAKDLNETGPDYTTGWGLVNATAAIDKIREDSNGTDVIMEGNVSNGETDTYYLYVSAGQALKITLTWDDYPGANAAAKKLVNNLDLVVTNSTSARFYPWTLDQYSPGSPAVQNTNDTTNNVEQVYVSSPGTGTWTVAVNGTAIPQGPQTYSLVSSHDFGLPIVSLNSPADGSYHSLPNITFNCSATDGSGLKNLTLYTNTSGTWQANQTANITGTSNSSAWNLTGVGDGSYSWNCLAYDNASVSSWATANRTFAVDAAAPRWSGNITSIVASYSTGLSYFNITWNDSTINSVFIEGNWSGSSRNYSTAASGNVYQYNAALPAGTFYWKSHANDSAGNYNVTASWIFTIPQASILINLTLNGTEDNMTIESPAHVNISAVSNVSGKNILLYKNGSNVANGTSYVEYSWNTAGESLGLYNITAMFLGDQNYTTAHDTQWITVNDTTKPAINSYSLSLSPVLPGENITISVNATDNLQVNGSAVIFNISNSSWSTAGNLYNQTPDYYNATYNTSSLAAGSYNVTVLVNDTSNNRANSSVGILTISGAAVLTVSVQDNENNATNASRITVLYSGTATARNQSGSNVTTFNSTLPAGVWDVLLVANTFNASLLDINVSTNTAGNITIDDNISENISPPGNILRFVEIVALNTTFNFSKVSLSVAYNDSIATNETRLQAYACHSWNMSSRTCEGSWENVTRNSTINITSNIAIINTTNLSAFSVVESYSCGDGIVDAGESCDGSNLNGQTCSSQGFSGGSLSCSVSCTFVTSACTTSSSSSGGGGGGGGGAAPSQFVEKKALKITSYPQKITVINMSRISVTLRNTGNANLTAVFLNANSTCENCTINVVPSNVSIGVNESVEFYLDTNALGQQPGDYRIRLQGVSGALASNWTELDMTIPLCMEGESKCNGTSLEVCNGDGWVLESCEFGCSDGVCNSNPLMCVPGSRRCAGTVIEECSKGGLAWTAAVACDYGCEDGACREVLGDYSVLLAVVLSSLIAAILLALYFGFFAGRNK